MVKIISSSLSSSLSSSRDLCSDPARKIRALRFLLTIIRRVVVGCLETTTITTTITIAPIPNQEVFSDRDPNSNRVALFLDNLIILRRDLEDFLEQISPSLAVRRLALSPLHPLQPHFL